MSDDLRERIADALWRFVMPSDAPDNDEDRAATLATADVVLAVVQPEIDRGAHKAQLTADNHLRALTAEAERDEALAALARAEAEVERLHPRRTNVRGGCCAPPKLCDGHADECGGSHYWGNRPKWPCPDLLTLRAAFRTPDGGSE